MAGARVLHWNGKDVPDELRDLPAGTYVVESVDETAALTREEEAGLHAAIASLDAGKERAVDDVRRNIDAIVHGR